MRTAVLGAVLLVLGGIAVAVGLLSPADAASVAQRVWPVLLFVVCITVVTELAAEAGLFTIIAEALARWGAGRAVVLWLMVVLLASLCTIFLSLDTTAVLLTPVVVGMARHARVPAIPFALTTVWLANCASLLLPVSNLTNLLAFGRIADDSPGRFAALTALPATVAILIPTLVIFVVYRRQLLVRYTPGEPAAPSDRVLLIAAASVVVLILPLLVSGIAVWIPALGGALVMVGFFAVRRRSALRVSIVPWQLVLLASGLFLVVAAAGEIGLSGLLTVVAGRGGSFGDLLRMAGTGAVTSNAINNLPAYLAIEPTTGSPARLIALLIGANAGPLITPWASLATLLWRRGLTAAGESISWRRYALLGCIAAPLTVVAATAALTLAG